MFYIHISFIESGPVHTKKSSKVEQFFDNLQSKNDKEIFKAYHKFFHKKYDINSKESAKRFNNFKINYKFIVDINKKNIGFKLTPNKLSDKSPQEIRKRLNYFVEKSEITINKVTVEEPPKLRFLQETPIQENIYYYWGDLFGEAIDQGECGSCWAFASLGVIEAQYKKDFNQVISLSVQHLLDCDTTNKGCAGGSPRNAMFTVQRFGIPFNSDYPYQFNSGTCNLSATENFMVEAVETCSTGSCTKDRIIELLQKGPIVTLIDAQTLEFSFYSSGILDYNCTTKNHAVILTGYVSTESQEYFIIRNSYGSSWGMNGEAYIKVKPSDLSCFIETYGYIPKILPLTSSPNTCIRTYQGCSYSGTSIEICDNNANFAGPIASFTNPAYESVSFFTKANCEGAIYTFNSDNICIANNSLLSIISNNVKSIVFQNKDPVNTGFIRLYDSSCFLGQMIEINNSIPDLATIGWGNRISSIKLKKHAGSYLSIIVYTGTYYSGISATISVNRFNFSLTFDKKIRSLRFVW